MNEKIDIQSLGGSVIHAQTTGLASVLVDNEAAAYEQAKKLLSFLMQDTIIN